jgi:hypothetical protein
MDVDTHPLTYPVSYLEPCRSVPLSTEITVYVVFELMSGRSRVRNAWTTRVSHCCNDVPIYETTYREVRTLRKLIYEGVVGGDQQGVILVHCPCLRDLVNVLKAESECIAPG